MDIQLIKGTVVNGKPYRAGDCIKTSPEDGALLVRIGHAVEKTAPVIETKAKRKPSTRKKVAK